MAEVRRYGSRGQETDIGTTEKLRMTTRVGRYRNFMAQPPLIWRAHRGHRPRYRMIFQLLGPRKGLDGWLTARHVAMACDGGNVLQVNPPKLVVVRNDDGWHDGTLSAWQKLEGRWRGFVTYSVGIGMRKLAWFEVEDIREAL